MEISTINNTLSLLAAVAVCEIEQSGFSMNYFEEINQQLSTLPDSVRNHFIDLWITISRCSEVTARENANNSSL